MKGPTKEEIEDGELCHLLMSFAKGVKGMIKEGGTLERKIFCPLCGKLVYASRAPGNGHLRLKCATGDCVSLIE